MNIVKTKELTLTSGGSHAAVSTEPIEVYRLIGNPALNTNWELTWDGASDKTSFVMVINDATPTTTGGSVYIFGKKVPDYLMALEWTALCWASAATTWTVEILVSFDDTIKFLSGANIVDDSIVTANIAAEAITVAEMADLTRGSLLTGQGATNRPTALDAKTSGYLLGGDGTDIVSYEVDATTGQIAVTIAGGKFVFTIQAGSVAAAMLASTAVAAGTYGSASVIPVFTVDAQGRITAVTNTAATMTPVGTALTSGLVWVGSAGNVAAAVSISQDATISNTGALTIAASAVTESKVGSATASDIITGVVCAKHILNAAVTGLLDTVTNNLAAFKQGDTILQIKVYVKTITAANLINIGADAVLRTAGADTDCFVTVADTGVAGIYDSDLAAGTYNGIELLEGSFVCDADGWMTITTTANVAATGIIGITIYYMPK